MTRFNYYSKIWWLLTKNAFSIVLGQKVALLFFLIGKIIRFVFFILFLYFLVSGTHGLIGYNATQVIFFFLIFNVIDILGQFMFREVYRFRPKIISGDFDLTLVKPANALFMPLFGGADVVDLITIPPLFVTILYFGNLLHPSLLNIFTFVLLTFNSLLIVTAFHIAVLALGIISLEIDNVILIYRDITSFGRFPVDIYKWPVGEVLTFLLPVGIMITFPAKALMGILSIGGVITSLVVGITALAASFKFWNFALKKYTSASS